MIFNKVAIFGESSIGWSMVVREDLRTYPGERELGGAPAYCPAVGAIRGGANVPAGVGFCTQVSIGRKVDRRCISYGPRHGIRRVINASIVMSSKASRSYLDMNLMSSASNATHST